MDDWQQTLDALKQHPHFPFVDFAEDREQYELTELYWSYLFHTVVGDNSDSVWRPWHPQDPTHEGNPIFSAINLTRKRGTRVIQHPGKQAISPPQEYYFAFQPFLAHTLAEPHDPETTVLELCFVADISAESESLARRFWEHFCVEFRSPEQVEAEIKKYEVDVGMPEP